MDTFELSIVINRPAEAVFEYLANAVYHLDHILVIGLLLGLFVRRSVHFA